MDPFSQPIKRIALPSGTPLTNLVDDAQQDFIFEASSLPIDETFVEAYIALLGKIETENYSRVLVADTAYLSLFPTDCIVVPTRGEAEDLVEMERIERDLGF